MYCSPKSPYDVSLHGGISHEQVATEISSLHPLRGSLRDAGHIVISFCHGKLAIAVQAGVNVDDIPRVENRETDFNTTLFNLSP